ncbi:AAA family ATPase [Sulfitobacter sp. D35]|uniref:AAA family ATPase n=1 Tax=Sulfitobacter sp. D35 TaxID=3083252 RepID=UPI00296EB254|nr:P-loop NTPase [Sulfitobacter sp. D35]MDW4499974.1 AAA family ATPase [Sulfitobacter sp. D35]
MLHDFTSLLLVTPDAALGATVAGLFPGETGIRVTPRISRLAELEGAVVSLAAQHDVILFDADAWDAADIDALERASAARTPNALLIALTPDDLSLASSRALGRAGADDVMPRGCVAEELAGTIESWRLRRAARLPAVWAGQATVGKVIAVTGSRGGVGKSTLAVNLADAMQCKKGFRNKTPTASVAVLDLDLQFGSVASLLDVDENDGLYRMAMEGSVPDREFVRACVETSRSGLTVLPAPTRFTPLDALQPEQISAILSLLCAEHDYVIVDMPSALVSWMEPVLARANRLFLATDITVPAVRTSRKLIDFYRAEQPGLQIEVVVTMEKKPLFLAQHHRAAIKLLDCEFHHWVPFDRKPARETLDRGKTVFEFAPHSALAKSIRSLAQATVKDLPLRASAPIAAE